MNKILSLISIFAALLLIACSCKKVETESEAEQIIAKSITLDKTSIVMELYEETTITANVLPDNTTDKNVKWSSNDEKIVTVEDGKLKAVGYGKTTITAASTLGNAKAGCDVVVFRHVDDLSFSHSRYSIYIGDKVKVEYSVMPEDATNKKISWRSSAPEVAIVNDEGEVTGMGRGSAIITATSEDMGKESECKIDVSYVYPTAIKFEKSIYETTVGQNLRILPKMEPENGSWETILWYSSDESVASIDGQGNIITLKSGFTDIKASGYKVEATFRLRVKRTKIPDGAIDLGLPSCTLWGICNVGATKAEEYGGFYSWGELEEKTEYSWFTYKFGMHYELSKYKLYDEFGGVLQKEDDVASVTLGGSWCTPKWEDFEELINNTDREWVEDYLGKGISGFIFKAKAEGYENNSIFIPAAGYKALLYHGAEKEHASLWTSQYGNNVSSNSYDARFVRIAVSNDKISVIGGAYNRHIGFNVRPVNRVE